MALVYKTYRSMEQNRNPRNNNGIYGQIIFNKGIQWRKDFSTNTAGTTRKHIPKKQTNKQKNPQIWTFTQHQRQMDQIPQYFLKLFVCFTLQHCIGFAIH